MIYRTPHIPGEIDKGEIFNQPCRVVIVWSQWAMVELRLFYTAVCVDAATVLSSGTSQRLGPRFQNRAIALRWLSNYLIATAENLLLDGDLDGLAAAYHLAADQIHRNGHATIGTIHYRINRGIPAAPEVMSQP